MKQHVINPSNHWNLLTKRKIHGNSENNGSLYSLLFECVHTHTKAFNSPATETEWHLSHVSIFLRLIYQVYYMGSFSFCGCAALHGVTARLYLDSVT